MSLALIACVSRQPLFLSFQVKVHNHLYNNNYLPMKFKVKEYCPLVFRDLRERFGLAAESYRMSMCAEGALIVNMAMSEAGRSRASFYESSDRKLVIKTLNKLEVARVHEILKEYHSYIVEHHSATLLPQFLGMYRLTVDDKEQYLMVMRNVCSSTLAIHERYDLKGSVLQRNADEKELLKETPTFKDNDVRAANKQLFLDDESKTRLFAQLERDTNFCASLNLMDYSLLVGVHIVDPADNLDELDVSEDKYAVKSSKSAYCAEA
jgi:1-phosphatidylinositol-5-phosphate 4-kinase